MRLSEQYQVCLFFFLREHFATQKTHAKKPTNKTKISEKKKQQKQQFSRAKTLYERTTCLFGDFFFRLKFLLKKFEIILIASFTRLLECAPLNLPMENLFACSYFYL